MRRVWSRTRELGFVAHAVDAQARERVAERSLGTFETIVAGEIIEHLDAPGPFLAAMLELAAPDSRLVLTTPNAYRLQNLLTPFSGHELIHPDHTAWHSPSTVRVLLERSGWRVDRIASTRARAARADPARLPSDSICCGR